MVVATNQPPENAVAIYLRRWEIEPLFSCLKEHAFNFEDTRITQRERIETLMAVLAMATAWVHKIGEWCAEKNPIKFKRYKNRQQRPKYSYFCYGLEFYSRIYFTIQRAYTVILRMLALNHRGRY